VPKPLSVRAAVIAALAAVGLVDDDGQALALDPSGEDDMEDTDDDPVGRVVSQLAKAGVRTPTLLALMPRVRSWSTSPRCCLPRLLHLASLSAPLLLPRRDVCRPIWRARRTWTTRTRLRCTATCTRRPCSEQRPCSVRQTAPESSCRHMKFISERQGMLGNTRTTQPLNSAAEASRGRESAKNAPKMRQEYAKNAPRMRQKYAENAPESALAHF
jgi:hypothetical protein